MVFFSPKALGKRNGAAYISVLIAFLILMIFITAIISLFNANLVQSKHQEKSIKAYYVARSGVDLAVSALTQQGIGGINDTLLYKEFSEDLKPDIKSTPMLTQTLSLKNGTVDITVKALNIENKRWIEVKSIGTLADTNISKTINLQFLVDNPSQQKWN